MKSSTTPSDPSNGFLAFMLFAKNPINQPRGVGMTDGNAVLNQLVKDPVISQNFFYHFKHILIIFLGLRQTEVCFFIFIFYLEKLYVSSFISQQRPFCLVL